jgi:four helix bundle protein
VAKQLIKASTAVAANYRAAGRARTPTKFAATVCEEADESQFWLDLTIAAKIVVDDRAKRLMKEASELTAILRRRGTPQSET